MWGIEVKQGYELETVLNSTFCYILLNEHPKMGHQPFHDSSSGAKVQQKSGITKSFGCFNFTMNVFSVSGAPVRIKFLFASRAIGRISCISYVFLL